MRPILTDAFISACIILAVLAFLCLYKAYKSPTVTERLIAINVIGTKTVVVISLVSVAYASELFLDIALVYALISFLAQVGFAKYLEKGTLD